MLFIKRVDNSLLYAKVKIKSATATVFKINWPVAIMFWKRILNLTLCILFSNFLLKRQTQIKNTDKNGKRYQIMQPKLIITMVKSLHKNFKILKFTISKSVI